MTDNIFDEVHFDEINFDEINFDVINFNEINFDEMGSGKKFERKKVRIGGKVELFSSRTFFLQIFLSSHRSSYATNLADHSF